MAGAMGFDPTQEDRVLEGKIKALDAAKAARLDQMKRG